MHVLLTKSDKLNRGPASKALQEVKAQLKKMKLQFSIQTFSSLNKQGLEELASIMGGRLNFTLEQAAEFDLASIPDAEADEFEEGSDDELKDDFDESAFEALDVDEITEEPSISGNEAQTPEK